MLKGIRSYLRYPFNINSDTTTDEVSDTIATNLSLDYPLLNLEIDDLKLLLIIDLTSWQGEPDSYQLSISVLCELEDLFAKAYPELLI